MRRMFRWYVALPASLWSVLAVQCLMNTSHFMAIPMFAVYMANSLGLGASEIGIVMAANIVARQTLPAFAGFLVDRFGVRRFMVSGLLLRAAGSAAFCYCTSWPMLGLVAAVIGLGSALYDSAAQGLIARHPGDLAAKGFVVNYQMLNIGAIIGPLLGALMLLIDLKAVFLASAALASGLAVMSLWQKAPACHGHEPPSVMASITRVFSNIPFLVLAIASIPWWFMLQQLFAAFPLYFENLAGERNVPFLFAVNALVGIGFMPISMLVMEKISPAVAMLLCYGLLSVLYAAMPFIHGASAFLVFIVLFSMLEIVITPAIEVCGTKLADKGSEATYLGIISLCWAIGGGAGYYAGTPVMTDSPQAYWILMAGTALAGILAMAGYFACDRAKIERSPAPAAADQCKVLKPEPPGASWEP
jgi:predicted MFS family arabinose efflux permease